MIEDHHLYDVYRYVQSEVCTSEAMQRSLYENWLKFRKHELPLFGRQCLDQDTSCGASVVHVDAVVVLLGALQVDFDAEVWDDFKATLVSELLDHHMELQTQANSSDSRQDGAAASSTNRREHPVS